MRGGVSVKTVVDEVPGDWPAFGVNLLLKPVEFDYQPLGGKALLPHVVS